MFFSSQIIHIFLRHQFPRTFQTIPISLWMGPRDGREQVRDAPGDGPIRRLVRLVQRPVVDPCQSGKPKGAECNAINLRCSHNFKY